MVFSFVRKALLGVLVLCGCYGMVPVLSKAQPVEAPVGNGLLNVFLDCEWRCPTQYIRTEITFINYVRDREDVDIHLLVTTNRTGSSGIAYAL